MSIYTIKTHSNPDFTIEADNYSRGIGVIRFFNYDEDSEEETIGELDSNSVVAIIKEEGCSGEVCLDCRLIDFLDSQEFFDEVAAIVEAYHSTNEPEVVPKAPKIELRSYSDYGSEKTAYGFVYDGKFVPFGGDKSGAEEGLANHTEGYRNWYTIPVEDTKVVPGVVQ